MGEVDLLGNEVRRIKSIIHRIAEEEETSGQIDIKVKMSTRDIEFETLSGTEKVRIGITAKNRDYWVSLLANVEKYAIKRLRNDTDIIASYKKLAS